MAVQAPFVSSATFLLLPGALDDASIAPASIEAFANDDWSAAQDDVIEAGDGLAPRLLRHQIDVAVAEWLAGFGVSQHDGVDDGAVAGKRCAQVIGRHVPCKIAYVYVHDHTSVNVACGKSVTNFNPLLEG
jgi:hypothetical protein